MMLACVFSVVLLVGGSDAVAGASASDTGPTVVGPVSSLWTQNSRTYQLSDGSLRDVVYPGAVNYQDQSSAWQSIDNSLIASAASGYAYENKANSLKLFLPSDIGKTPVRVTSGASWVTFGLRGAQGTPSVANSTVATYAGVLPGVSVSYAAIGASVKESVVLASPAAAAQPLVFDVATSAGLTPKPTGLGALAFLDSTGKTAFSFAEPSMQDASNAESGYSTAVSYTVVGAPGGGWTVTLVPKQSFLLDAARQWPVTVDPTVTAADTQDCYITSGVNANDNYCTATAAKIRVGYQSSDAEKRRGLVQFDVSAIPAQSTVLDAQFGMNLQAATTTNSDSYDVYALTHSWTNGATWNKYDGTNSWTAGGSFDTTKTYATLAIAGSTLGFKYWYPTGLVQGWVDGLFANDGLLLRQRSETTTNLLDFTSMENANSTLWPKLTVDYANRAGDAHYWTYFRQRLNDRMAMGVNVANGNLVVHAQDLHVAGTDGMDLSVDRYYNSNLTPNEDYGPNSGWQMGVGSGVELEAQTSGDVLFEEPSGTHGLFLLQSGGSYKPPPAISATLVKNGDSTYTLTWNNLSVWQFDTGGKLTSTTDANKNAITYTYNGGNNLTTITDTQGRTVSFTRTGGSVTQMTDNAGSRIFGYAYDSNSRLKTYTDPLLKTTQYGYDSNNNLNKITDPRGNVILVTYDSQKRVSTITRVTDPVLNTGPTWSFAYPAFSSGTCGAPGNPLGMTTVTDPDSHTTTYCYDSLGQATNIVDARSLSHNPTYDPNGNVTQFSQLNGTGSAVNWAYTYDTTANQDLQVISQPVSAGSPQLGATETICYAGAGCNGHTGGGSGPAHFPTSVYSFNNDTTTAPSYTYTYDSRGNPLTASNPNDGATTYTWGTPSGFVNTQSKVLQTIKDANSNTTNLGYDSEGNLSSITRPSPGDGNLVLTYDALSRVRTVTDGKGVTATYTYDALDHVKTVTFSDSTHSLTYGYDENGNLTSRVDAIGSWGFTYDPLNRRLTETRPSPDPTVTYTYYDSGPIHTITDGSGITTYAYNAVNLPNSIKDPQNTETTISYLPMSNQRDTVTYPNGVTVATTWKNAGQMDTLTVKHNTTVLLTRNYNYTDPANSHQDFARLNSTNDGTNTTTYTYNAVDRVKTATTGSQVYNYNLYDNNGNLTKMTSPSGTVTQFTYNADNELTCKYTGAACSGSGFTTYTYDATGNLTASSTGFSATYNALNQLTTGSNTYADAGQTLRIGSGTKHFTYSLLGTAAETNGSSTTNYLHNSDGTLLGMATGTGSSSKDYYILDGLGSVIGVTDSTGALARSYTYDPYGNSNGGTGSLSQPWQYASGYLDNTTPTSGFYKFGTRYYDTTNARWTQLDPKSGSLGDPMSQDGYLYVNDDPLNAVDASGASGVPLGFSALLAADSIGFTSGLAYACIVSGIAFPEAIPVIGLACAPAIGVGYSVAGYEIYNVVTSIF